MRYLLVITNMKRTFSTEQELFCAKEKRQYFHREMFQIRKKGILRRKKTRRRSVPIHAQFGAGLPVSIDIALAGRSVGLKRRLWREIIAIFLEEKKNHISGVFNNKNVGCSMMVTASLLSSMLNAKYVEINSYTKERTTKRRRSKKRRRTGNERNK